MSKRTQHEVAALARVIYSEICKKREVKFRSKETKAKAKSFLKKKGLLKYSSEIIKLEKEIKALELRKTKAENAIYKALGPVSSFDERSLVLYANKRVLNQNNISITNIKDQIILAQDEGSDILIKNITEMFV